MNTSVRWLNQYLDQPADADQIEKVLTDQGLPIESRQSPPGDGDDVVLDVEVTSNRPDCLCHLGLAREVAAGTGRRLIPPPPEVPPEVPPPPEVDPDGSSHAAAPSDLFAGIRNDQPDRCPLYTARVIQGVKVGPSPGWLVQRLASVGLRTVNNIVDVTNFVLMELGQPLHAFDLAKLRGRAIVVRTAADGERFTAIDGSEHRLCGDMLVIADAQQPVAVAGVMGGLDSEVSRATTDILLESALFDPMSVRRTSRALKLHSDSSYRFERGVDPIGVEAASRRAAAMIRELAGGRLAGPVVRVGIDPPPPRSVTMRLDRCRALLGLALETDQVTESLQRLGLDPQPNTPDTPNTPEPPEPPPPGQITCRVPSFRLDLHREIDLIEEVARLRGYDAIPIHEKLQFEVRPVQSRTAAKQKLRQVLVTGGYHETVTFSSVNPRFGQPFVPEGAESVMIEHDHRSTEPMLRPSVLPSLLLCRKSNQDAGNTGLRLFETASTWVRREGEVHERACLAILTDQPPDHQGVRIVRGVIELVIQELTGRTDPVFEPAPIGWCSTAARIRCQDRDLGWLGLIHPEVQRLFDLQSPVILAELALDPLLEAYPPARRVHTPPRYPGIERDLSIIIEEKTSWARVAGLVHGTEPALLESLRFLGVYRGKPIPPGQKSVSLRMVFRDPEATLRHEQVDPQVTAVVAQLQDQLGARLRG